MYECPGAAFARSACDRARSQSLHSLEPLAATLEHDAHEVDHRRGPPDRCRDGIRVAEIGLHGMNLANPAQRLQVHGEIGAPDCNANAPTPLGKRPHDVATDESGPSEYSYQAICGDLGHAPSCLRRLALSGADISCTGRFVFAAKRAPEPGCLHTP
jgi:hypothetical protein